ncbi:MAG: DMT family transporter [Candidatus Hydrogenedentales bacterium]
MNRDSAKISMEGKHQQTLGIAAMVACAFCWSLAGIFIKLIDWQPFAIAGGRSAIAAVFIFLFLKGKPKFSFSAAQILCALAYAATMLLFVFANKTTTSANAILLQYGAPIYVAFMSAVVLKEPPKAEDWLALVGICGGMVLFFIDSLGKGNLIGDLAAVASGVSFALNIVLLRKQRSARPLDSLLLGHIFTAVVAGAISLFLPAPVVTMKSIFAIGCLGVIQIGLAAVLLSYSLQRITALQSVLLAVIEPLFNPVWVFLATREAPGLRSILGGLIIIAAVLASSFVSVRRTAKAIR